MLTVVEEVKEKFSAESEKHCLFTNSIQIHYVEWGKESASWFVLIVR